MSEQPLQKPALPDQQVYTPAEIVGRLKDFHGRPLGPIIQDRLREHSGLKKIIITGRPGGGKTTGRLGFESIQQNELGLPEAELERRLFDIIRADFFKKLQKRGSRARSIPELSPKEHSEWKYTLTQALLAPTHAALTIWETPAVGLYERGQTALQVLGEQMMQQRRRNLYETLVIHMISAGEVEHVAKQVQATAAECKNDYELKLKLQLIGIDEGEPLDEDLRSTKLLSLYQKRATAAQIESINAEHMKLVEPIYAKLPQLERRILENMDYEWLSKTMNITTQSDWIRILKNVIYANHQYYHEFSFPVGSEKIGLIVAINTFAGKIRYRS